MPLLRDPRYSGLRLPPLLVGWLSYAPGRAGRDARTHGLCDSLLGSVVGAGSLVGAPYAGARPRALTEGGLYGVSGANMYINQVQ